MDFIYSQLPEVVEDMIYQPLEGDGTVKINIDNTKKTIEANVLKTPGTLNINNINSNIIFNGDEDKTLNIPKYRIKKINQGNENATYKWSLFEYNFLTNDYDINCGDVEFGQDESILNIENGSSDLNNGAISSKTIEGIAKGSTATGIQSFSFGGNDLNIPNSFQVIQIENFNEIGEVIGNITLDLISKEIDDNGNSYKIILKDRDTKAEYVFEGIKNIAFTQIKNDTLLAYSSTSNYWAARFENNVLEISVVLNMFRPSRDATHGPYKAYLLTTNANGDQAISIGQGTQANANQSQAFGIGTITSYPGQMVIGRYNKPVTNALFIIGNGIDEFNRSNALVVYADGTTIASKQIKVEDATPDDNYNENEIVTMEVLDNYQFDDGILRQ